MELLFNNNHHYLFKLWGFYSVHGNQSPLSCDLSLLFFILSMGTPFYGHSSLSAAKRKKGNAVGLHDGALKKIIIKNNGIPISICSTASRDNCGERSESKVLSQPEIIALVFISWGVYIYSLRSALRTIAVLPSCSRRWHRIAPRPHPCSPKIGFPFSRYTACVASNEISQNILYWSVTGSKWRTPFRRNEYVSTPFFFSRNFSFSFVTRGSAALSTTNIKIAPFRWRNLLSRYYLTKL